MPIAVAIITTLSNWKANSPRAGGSGGGKSLKTMKENKKYSVKRTPIRIKRGQNLFRQR